jgi:hypothetical protein
MRVLFVVFVLSLAALIFTLMALRRHIRNHDARNHDSRSGEHLPLTGTPQEDSLKQND